MPAPKDLLNTVQAARQLGISARQVQRMFHAGCIPGAYRIGRRIVIPAEAVWALRRGELYPMRPPERVARRWPVTMEST